MRERTVEGSTPSIDAIVQVTLSDGPDILEMCMPTKKINRVETRCMAQDVFTYSLLQSGVR